jgi:hypothetical protein
MPAYERSWFEPPAPVANVTLRNPANDLTVVNIPLLLDTGADVTLLPQSALIQLGLLETVSRHYELVGFDGTRSLAAAYTLELSFCRRSFRGQFLSVDQEWGILGRNVLNAVPLLLDGPSSQWDEHR